jgi:tyrosine-specific transport protein
MNRRTSIFSVAVMVLGTMVGGGVLAMPVVAGDVGFIPGLCVCVGSWVMMMTSGLIMADEYMHGQFGGSLGAMYGRTLGVIGKSMFTVVYCVMFSGLLTAYLSGLSGVLSAMTSCPQRSIAIIAWVIFFLLIGGNVRRMFFGNTLLTTLLLISFCGLLVLCTSHVRVDYLIQIHGSEWLSLFPIFLGSFGYQGSIPAFCRHLNNSRPAVFRAIVGGTVLTCVLYILFLSVTLGSLPRAGIRLALENDWPITTALGYHFEKCHLLGFLGQSISVLAIVTSFVGVTEGFAQFLSDEFQWFSVQRSRTLVLLIPLVGFFLGKNLFVGGLVLTGVGCGVLFGFVPSLMWTKRHWGRRACLWGILLCLAFAGAVAIEIKNLLLPLFR